MQYSLNVYHSNWIICHFKGQCCELKILRISIGQVPARLVLQLARFRVAYSGPSFRLGTEIGTVLHLGQYYTYTILTMVCNPMTFSCFFFFLIRVRLLIHLKQPMQQWLWRFKLLWLYASSGFNKLYRTCIKNHKYGVYQPCRHVNLRKSYLHICNFTGEDMLCPIFFLFHCF